MRISHRNHRRLPAMLACLSLCGLAHAGTLEVVVRVQSPGKGVVGCTLYGSEAGFPMDASKGHGQQWHPATANVTCRFDDLEAGTYAVAVSQDLNGNKKVDTNFVGMPKEAWGVSRNARPALRAPKFAEAAFKVEAEGITRITIEAKK